MNIPLPAAVLLGAAALLGVGFYCLLATRSLIKVIVALQIMVKGVLLALVLAGNVRGQVQVGQSMVLTVIVADTVVAVIGLALAVQVRRTLGTMDLGSLSRLKK